MSVVSRAKRAKPPEVFKSPPGVTHRAAVTDLVRSGSGKSGRRTAAATPAITGGGSLGLIEIAMFLTIAALVIVGVMTFYKSALDAKRRNDAAAHAEASESIGQATGQRRIDPAFLAGAEEVRRNNPGVAFRTRPVTPPAADGRAGTASGMEDDLRRTRESHAELLRLQEETRRAGEAVEARLRELRVRVPEPEAGQAVTE